MRRHVKRTTFLIVLFLLLALIAFAQGSWGLGGYTFTSGNSSGPLEYSLASSSLDSYDFVSNVGGVAFKAVAAPATSVSNSNPVLHYDKAARDGQRLEVRLGEQILNANLPDWLLIPIAKYADSRFDACVSLFGPNTRGSAYDIIYHEAFQNTLLGLRLLHADILLFDLDETWRLPTWNGQVMLGTGESAASRMDAASARIIDDMLSKGKFQSWVFTDDGENVVFDADGTTLRLTGQPYYHFWTADMDAYDRRVGALEAQADQLVQAGRVAEHNRIIDQINSIDPEVHNVTVLTEGGKRVREALRRFNPAVNDAATNTMRFAAFFRFVKKQDPAGWNTFLAQLKPITIEPAVTTPTRWNH